MTGDPNYSTVGPEVLAEQFEMWELWLWDDDRQDYLMVQMIAPDILIAPRFKRINEFRDVSRVVLTITVQRCNPIILRSLNT